MQRTLIIGASGQIGKKLTQKMVDAGLPVSALVRDKEKLSDLEGNSLKVVEADLLENFEHAYEECDKVIFVAGSGGDTGADKTLMIDLWAACKAVDYAKRHDIKHFIMVSSIGADSPSDGPSEMQPYLVAKHMADEHLIYSGVPHTILRPGTLVNDDANNGFTSKRPDNKKDAKITRADVASALAYIAKQTVSDNRITELFNGDKSLDTIFAK